MDPRYFWRRGLAYFCDLILAGLFFGLLVFILDLALPIKIIAPQVPNFYQCEDHPNPFSEDAIHEMLRLKEGEVHYQSLCRSTNGFLNTSFQTVVGKRWDGGSQQTDTNIAYYSDADGKPVTVLRTDPLFAIFAPLLFAIILARYGTTPARYQLILAVCDENERVPGFVNALKREYLKWLPLIASSAFSLTDIYRPSEEIDRAALQSELAKHFAAHNPVINTVANENTISASFFIIPAVLTLLFFGFYFGSFIFWKGQTFWDRFASLYTIGPEDTDKDEND